MAKRKKYKRTNNDLQNIHIKLNIEKHTPYKKSRVSSGAPKMRVGTSCSTSGTLQESSNSDGQQFPQ
jgi:hypothetical protein